MRFFLLTLMATSSVWAQNATDIVRTYSAHEATRYDASSDYSCRWCTERLLIAPREVVQQLRGARF